MITRQIRIAVLATVTDFGGAERVVLSLIRNIHADRFDVVPIIFTWSKLLETVFFRELNKTGRMYHTIFADRQKIKYLNPLANIIEAYTVLQRYKFDLIHTHGYRCDILGIILAKLTGLPVVSTCHGFISNDINLKFYNKLDRSLLKYADKIMAVSEGIKKDLILSGIKESRISLVQNAVVRNDNRELFVHHKRGKRRLLNIDEKEFVVGYVGRLSEEKGVKYLIEAHSLLIKAGLPARLLVIGDGPQRKELEDLVEGLGVGNSIVFTGFQSEIEAWLPAMDIFVLPSLTEGTPMALLEAMNEGVPVIASAVGGVPQVVDSGKNGILVSPGKSGEIKKAIYDLYSNELLRQQISQEARQTIAARYNVAEWINKVEMEYLKAVN